MSDGQRAADPASVDPRAYRTQDADGRPVAVFTDGEGSVWLDVHGELARLGEAAAMKLGGRLGGAARRTLGSPPGAPAPGGERPPRGYRELAERLQRRIEAGEFGDAGRLPPSPELAERYGVGRGTVDGARRELERRGLVTVTLGLGTFVVPRQHAERPASPVQG